MRFIAIPKLSRFAAMGAAALLATASQAAVVQSTGAGSAVSMVQGSADFESVNALNDNPYSEGGMDFSRQGLSFNNNGCGFAGCGGHLGFAGFTGNYMYGVGGGGSFTMAAVGGNRFLGLEMIMGTGYFQSNVRVTWQAFDGVTIVGNGDFSAPVTAVVGFADMAGFTSLQFTSTSAGNLANFSNTVNAPAFDSVRAQFTNGHVVPEPGALSLTARALVGLAALARRRKK